ncbi:tetratricopeptide repeat (TPR)-like superfamily protein [Actinidia rufa]|uniref:Tetratricopeptide repeat (TPR)-like superfamily protein n=1 Tax=Actinidia rufa TaxID=165716 RepID=A0A7J0FY27_9ERIC|nr:tetratricopeptide repeat (TPR)-like superfamily protein [Actinidia rufa]
MERDYSMKLKMEHYACMVDLLGRTESLKQSWEFMMAMPDKPNSDVRAALLSANRLQEDVEMANVAAYENFKLIKNSSPKAYVTLSYPWQLLGNGIVLVKLDEGERGYLKILASVGLGLRVI